MSKPLLMAPDARDYCRRHLEPFRESWPTGYGVFAVLMLQHVLADDRFTEPLPRGEDGLIDLDDSATLEATNARLRSIGCPACFAGDEIAALVTDRALNGNRGS